MANKSVFEMVESGTRISIPLAVVIERRIDPKKKWGYPEWRIFAIVSGEYLDTGGEQLTIHEEGNIQRRFHGGLKLELFKDGSEGYWYNLLSDQPFLFVVCEGEQTAAEIEPYIVTANQDEATGYLESDDIVLSAPMPDEIRELLERYVTNHFQPEVKKKRKRRDWLQDSDYASKRSGGAKQGG